MSIKESQNIYDNEEFFDGYRKLRENPNSANVLEEIPAIMSLCPDFKDKKVLDLGCGYGDNCKRFADMGAKLVVGVDISEKMLKVANRENKLENIKYYNVDMINIDTLKERFDIVISSLAIHYVENLKDLVIKIHTLLTKEGILIFSQEHPLTTAPIKGASWTKDENGTLLHYNLFDYGKIGERKVSWFVDNVTKYHRTFSDIINSLISAGFTIESMIEPIPTQEIIDRLPNYINHIHKPNFLIIRAKKI